MYDPVMVQPMRDELTAVGFRELKTAEDVDALMAHSDQTSLLFINSVCGCAAGVARPGVIGSLKNPILPQDLTTAFAGNDIEAVGRARDHLVGYPPSSPCVALFRDGEAVFVLERHQIEGQTVDNITKILTSAFEKFCGETIDDSVEIYDPVKALLISAKEAEKLISANPDLVVLDAREPHEIQEGAIRGAVAADVELARKIVASWPRNREIIVYGQQGKRRSLQVVQFLRHHGFEKSWNLIGGFAAWPATTK